MSETIYILAPNGELYHHGVKGQKWGVRRYQNKDGSLTVAGKKRLVSYDGSQDKQTKISTNTVKTKSNTKVPKTEAELIDEITERKARVAERGKKAAAIGLIGVGSLGINAVTATTMGVVELKSLATGAIAAGGGAVLGAMAGIESIKVASLERQLKRVQGNG